MATGMFSGGAAFGNPNLARQVARTRELQAARSYDVNTLPDPQTYAFAQGFFGEAPDQLGFSRLHPDYAKIIGRGEQGMLSGGVSMIGPTAQAIKGLGGIGVRALGPTAGRMAEGYLQRQGLMPNIVPEAPKNLFGGPIEKPQAPVSELGFYSAAEQAALNLPRKSGTGESFLNDLMKGQDVKRDELSWMGLDDYLKGKPNVTRQEVQDFISANRVDVREVRLGGKSADQQKIDLQDKRDNLARSLFTGDETIINGKRVFDDELGYMLVDGNININQLPQAKQAVAQEWVNTYTKLQNFQPEPAFNTKYQQYQLPGGENYREILLTLPPKAPKLPEGYSLSKMSNGEFTLVGPDGSGQLLGVNTKDAALSEVQRRFSNKEPTFSSSHFNEPNILAHMRVNDRVDADGKKMLLIEEVQSDWHQAGREKGYSSTIRKPSSEEKQEWTQLDAIHPNNRTTEQYARLNELDHLMAGEPQGVPDAPFKDSWHQLALKRALKYAADNGYDRVGLTTGKQQIDRYANEIRQNVDELQFFPIGNQNNILISAKKGGKQTFSGTVADGKFIDGPAEGKTVTEVLGKSMANQIAEKKDGVIKGDDLTIGGEGMKAYYDEIYPAFLNKQGKKYNAKTGETIINSGKIQSKDELAAQVYGRGMTYRNLPSEQKRKIDEMGFGKGAQSIRYIDISPEMRDGVKKGQPLFTAAPIGGIGLGAGMQDNEMPEAVRQYMADPRYSDPFADSIR